VRYQPTNLKGVYNLAFGDKDHETGDIDDTIVSNNGDSEKVLATVAATVYAFTDKYPEAWIYATGSTKSRTRLYRMGITRFLSEAKDDFEILGERNAEWENFRKDIDSKTRHPYQTHKSHTHHCATGLLFFFSYRQCRYCRRSEA
jgi:hypothetical protein